MNFSFSQETLRLWAATIFLALLSSGCDISESTVDHTLTPIPKTAFRNDIQFADPDPLATSDVERMGYPILRDLSRELVSASYLDLYFDIDTAVGELLKVAADAEDGTPIDCPEGGTVSALVAQSDNTKTALAGSFADCNINGRTVFGTLEREVLAKDLKNGRSLFVAVTFDIVDIDAGDDGQLLVSGSAMRAWADSSPDEEIDTSTCESAENNVRLTQVNTIHTARLERADIPGSVSINDSTYERDESRVLNVESVGAACSVERSVSENGSAVVTFSDYGVKALNGQATISTTINSDTALQETELPDGSTLRINAFTGEEGKAQIDVLLDDVITSFYDSFRFQASEFKLLTQ